MVSGSRLLALLGLISLTISLQDRPVFRSGAGGVLVDVGITNNKKPVPSLTTADFALMDVGVPQRILDVSIGNMPLDVTLILDSSYSIDHTASEGVFGSRHLPASGWMKSGVAVVMRLLTRVDRVQVLRVGTAVVEVRDVSGITGDPVVGAPGLGTQTALFDAILAAVMQPVAADRRHIVVALTDGRDTISAVDYTVRRRVLDRADAVVYLVACGNRDFMVSEARSRVGINPVAPWLTGHDDNWLIPYGGYDWILRETAEQTGGQFYMSQAEGDFLGSLRAAFDEFRARYVLSFQPEGVAPTGWHPLNVTVPKHREYQIRARRGYYASLVR